MSVASFLGVGPNVTPHREKWLSGIGGGLAVTLVVFLGLTTSDWLNAAAPVSAWPVAVASMAASAALLFALPHAPLSQPWPVVGGHVVSAVTGVWCALHIEDTALAGGVAAGGAITLMYYLRCMHPPGGATALSAVLSTPLIADIGYRYAVFPVLTGTLALVVFALLFNFAFPWRRYPAYLFFRSQPTPAAAPVEDTTRSLSQEDFFAAMQAHGSFVDITADGLTELLESARQHARQASPPPEHLAVGQFFSNGALGQAWCVRQIMRIDNASGADTASLHYQVVAGNAGETLAACSADEFRRWARFEVVPAGPLWRKRAAP